MPPTIRPPQLPQPRLPLTDAQRLPSPGELAPPLSQAQLLPTPQEQHLTPLGPVGSPSQTPRADLPGIAAEVGRIESKLNLMALNDAISEPIDLSPIQQLLEEIKSRLDQPYAGGTYKLDSPCEKLPNKQKAPPVEVEYPASAGFENAIFERLDALADLLQVHKNLKQPNCIPPKASGNGVTVTFEAVGD